MFAASERANATWCAESGGISTFEQAEELLRDGIADIIASARQSLADPDWFRKLRMGLGGEGYLASPAVVASSALLGYLAPPSELGLEWDPETFGL